MSAGPEARARLAKPRLLRVSAAYLATLVRVGFNKKAYQPSVKAIMDKYYEMFRGKTDASDENEEECAPSATAGSSSATAGSGSSLGGLLIRD